MSFGSDIISRRVSSFTSLFRLSRDEYLHLFFHRRYPKTLWQLYIFRMNGEREGIYPLCF